MSRKMFCLKKRPTPSCLEIEMLNYRDQDTKTCQDHLATKTFMMKTTYKLCYFSDSANIY